MTPSGWIQLALYVGALVALTKPMGKWLAAVLDPQGRTVFDPVLRPVERFTYRLLGIDPHREQSWGGHAVAMLAFSAVTLVFTFVILETQRWLPLNPAGMDNLSWHLAFNTAASFTTNTNWQSCGGETTMSHFSQMVALASQNFWSAAVGIAIAAALVRGIARDRSGTVGNFWVDFTRITLYLLLPLCLVYALFLVSQGMVQNFSGPVAAQTTEGGAQSIAQGPVASQIAIKMLGTNGGGFYNANAAHPYENPTPLSNFVQMLSIFLIPSGLTWHLGRSVKDQRHGWSVWGVMAALFLVGVLICWWAEAHGNTRLAALGVDPAGGNMEGKEVRFGIFNSALFAAITTDASCGAVNSMHDSFTPLGGLIPMLNIQLGEIIFGGVGAGLYGMLVFVVVAIFIAGLMIGRTPECLGKKIEAFDVKMAVLALLVPALSILGFTAWAVLAEWGNAGLLNHGPHGLSEILYAYSSGTGNNGSAFAGLTANAPFYNVTLGLAMLIGRFGVIVPVLALAGSLAGKRRVESTGGSFPVSGLTFGILLASTILIVGALTFFPVLGLGPIIEHIMMLTSGRAF